MGSVSRLYSPFHVVMLAEVNHFVGLCSVPPAECLGLYRLWYFQPRVAVKAPVDPAVTLCHG